MPGGRRQPGLWGVCWRPELPGGFFSYQHHQEQARIAAAREAEHQRQLVEERAREAEEELARVDRDVSREVPNALEPLAQLMTEDDSQ